MEFFINSIEKVIGVPLDDAFGFFFCTLCGVLISWIYKCRKEGIKLSSYWLENIGSSLGVFGAAIAAFLLTIISEPGVGKITYLAIGMAADSMLNKPPLPMAVKVALDKIEAVQNAADPDNPSIVTPASVRADNEQSAACAHAVEQIGKNYTVGVPTGKTDPESGNG